MGRLPKAKSGDNVHGHTAVGEMEICAFGNSTCALEGIAERFDIFDDQALYTLDCRLRERASNDIPSILSFSIGQETKARSVLIEALVETSFLIPSIFIVVNVVIGRRV
jgi:hypothetical protein